MCGGKWGGGGCDMGEGDGYEVSYDHKFLIVLLFD